MTINNPGNGRNEREAWCESESARAILQNEEASGANLTSTRVSQLSLSPRPLCRLLGALVLALVVATGRDRPLLAGGRLRARRLLNRSRFLRRCVHGPLRSLVVVLKLGPGLGLPAQGWLRGLRRRRWPFCPSVALVLGRERVRVPRPLLEERLGGLRRARGALRSRRLLCVRSLRRAQLREVLVLERLCGSARSDRLRVPTHAKVRGRREGGV